VLAAHRAGIRRVILPARNEADLEDIPAEVRGQLEVKLVSRISEALDAALDRLVSDPPPDINAPDAAAREQHAQQQPEPVHARKA
jgi:ATP-dependent Lon protease